MYINDVIYTLDSSKSNEYYFILKTDIWLEGRGNTDGIGDSDKKKEEDKEKYPFIPLEIHETYQGKKDKIEKSGHNTFVL